VNPSGPPRPTPRGDFERDGLLDAWPVAYAKEAMLSEKIALLNFIEKNEYLTGGFLQGPTDAVQDFLGRLAGDAKDRLEEENDHAIKWANDVPTGSKGGYQRL